jgi:hypothetical protein
MAAEVSTITAILEDAREDLPGPSQVQAQPRPEASAPQNQENDVEESPIHNEEKTNEESEDVLDHRDFKLSNAGRLIFFALAVLTLMVALDGTSISVALPVPTTTLYPISHRI